MMTFSSSDTLDAMAGATGVEYAWDGATINAGVPTFGGLGTGTLPITTPASIWAALGGALNAVARLICKNTTAGDIQVTLYKNGGTQVLTTFLVLQGGTSIWNGGSIKRYDQFGAPM